MNSALLDDSLNQAGEMSFLAFGLLTVSEQRVFIAWLNSVITSDQEDHFSTPLSTAARGRNYPRP
jgi:hypothetical protein